ITLTETSLDLSAGASLPPWAHRASSGESGLEISTHLQTDPDVAGRAAPPVAADPGWPRVDGFDILGTLGSGGMGAVYRAYDRRYRRHVALKTMDRAGAVALLRFKHEFRALLDVVHPNLVTLHELICDGRQWVLTMELLDGVDFLRYVRDEATPQSLPKTHG